MTVAVDIKTGAIVGQVVNLRPLVGAEAGISAWPKIRVLTRDGYQDVPAASVRLEKVS